MAACILLPVCMEAQAFHNALLPQPQHIAGVVVDQEGNPIVEACIDTCVGRQAHKTDSQGRFEVDTRSPVVVVRKTGFKSELVRPQDSRDVQITLLKAETRPFPTCPKTGQYDGIDGWGAQFRFPRMPGVKVSPQGHDVDYGARNYYVETPKGAKGIMHGSGPLWSFGTPSNTDVWRSVKYEEVVYDWLRDLQIIDARGQFPDGNRWRYLGKFGESAGYSDVDEATAKILDQLLDGACLSE